MKFESDILIIGSGIAGMCAAYYAAENGLSVYLITKGDVKKDSNTYYAQGGIIYKGEKDSTRNLIKDIVRAGANLSNPFMARILAEEGPYYIQDLLINTAKIHFTKNQAGKLDLAEEAAHSVRRIIHSKDATGKAITEGLLRLMKKQKNIKIFRHHMALDLILKHEPTNILFPKTVLPETLGAYILDINSKTIKTFIAKATILATGGIGKIYSYTTNSLSSTGDGLAIAERAGAKLLNMEYTQFHPTALYQSKPNMFLISEAVRGEGGELKTINNILFMKKYHSKGSLASRDIVARAIHKEMLKRHHPYMLLDIHNYLSPVTIKKKFPTIHKTCLENNIDITQQSIPVVPAFHFICGGIKVNKYGKTNIRRLFAAGEVSCTGIHGANRLASTSLLEGLVWGGRISKYLSKHRKNYVFKKSINIPKLKLPVKQSEPVDSTFIKQDWDNLKNIMWNYVGLIRTAKRLTRALKSLKNLYDTVTDFYKNNLLEKDVIELKNGIQTGILITRQAIKNKRSRGTHFRID